MLAVGDNFPSKQIPGPSNLKVVNVSVSLFAWCMYLQMPQLTIIRTLLTT